MNDIWLSEQLDLRIISFRCMPTGKDKGLVCFLENLNEKSLFFEFFPEFS